MNCNEVLGRFPWRRSSSTLDVEKLDPRAFLLAEFRFGRVGRRAAVTLPSLMEAVVRGAYSREVSSAGFWPGSGSIDYPHVLFVCQFRTSEVGPTESFSERNSASFCCLMRRSEATSILMQRFLPSCNRLTKLPLAAKRFPVSLDFGDGLIQINDDIADLDDDRPTTFHKISEDR
jgi:uncharacterized protein DUF5996